ncbi:TPA: SIR2 family protein [Escherichia coli]|uniref:nSTAND3 domain-containing NTPase n=1 Tax=Escherichia coli TaxID=562 RepID=UPI0035BF6686|nr:SIR2 family protein [Escherichia coli]HCN8541632.1 SIR2 family protein [Escherichia coli]
MFENPELQEKTYFVVRDGADFKEIFTLRKYGHVLPIGVDRFSDLMKDVQKQSHEDGVIFTETLVKYEVFDTQTDFRDIDSERLFLYGDYEIEKLHDSIRRIETIPYFIKRDIIPVCLNNIKNNNNIIITGDLGNGKSIVLEMLAYELTVNGFHTYILRNNDGDYVSDLDQIIKHEGTAVIIIDNCSNHPGLIKHIFEVKADNLIYVFADRNSNDIKFNISLDFIEHNIDLLSSDEIASAVKIIDNLSTWQKFSALSTERKKRLVYEKYDAQLSLLLLGLINSPNIKTKIKQQTDLIYSNPDHKKSVFCICICEVANVEPTSSLVSEISGTNAIYHTSLRNSPPFNQIFKVNGATIKSKSSILSLSLLNNTFSDIYVRDVLLEIVERTDSIKDQDIEIKKIFKALLRFHIVERILPKNQSALDRYYEQLKYRCTWLMDSPHYWVQYAMCRLSFSDYNRAQNYLTNAYQKAETKKGSYHTDNIDTQQARLYLNQCLDHNNSSECYNLFNKAHALLVKLPNEGRKFRQVLLYKKVFDLKYQSFSKKNKTDFEQACKKLLDQTKPDNVYPINTNMVRFITSAEEALIEILNTIMLERT